MAEMPLDERRFTDEEVRKILRTAVERAPSKSLVKREGLSLAELKSIAEKVGIDSDRLEDAARAVALGGSNRPSRFFGGPTILNFERKAEGEFDPDDTPEILSIIRRTMGTQGEVDEIHGSLEWRAKGDSGERYVTLTPRDGTTAINSSANLTNAAVLTLPTSGSDRASRHGHRLRHGLERWQPRGPCRGPGPVTHSLHHFSNRIQQNLGFGSYQAQPGGGRARTPDGGVRRLRGSPMEELPGSPKVPDSLRKEYKERRWDVAYQYGPEALTYQLSRDLGETRFLKLARAGCFPMPEDEASRMRWAYDFLPVPDVIEQDSSGSLSWLITEALPGRDATDPALTADPQRLVAILAAGLRAFHEAPVEACPFDFRLDAALAQAHRRLEAGQIVPERDFHDEFVHLSAGDAIGHLNLRRPDSETLVVCHGDYCLPNILIEAGVATGFVDLGELGVADRWWDVAVATWSLTWNLGPGYEDLFLEEYGLERDDDRVDFYRLLYDVVS
jgi:kanamycin kinase